MKIFQKWRTFREAQKYHRHGACRRAAALYEKLLALDPADRGALLWSGLALAERGRFSEAIERINHAITLGASAGRLFLARVLVDGGRLQEARDLLVDLLREQENQHARGLLALCLVQAGELEDAKKTAIALPASEWLLSRLLLAIEEKAETPTREQPAVIEAASAAALNPGWLQTAAHLRRGLVYLRAERWEKAVESFRSAAGSMPHDARAAYGLGVSLYYLGHFEESRRRLLEAQGRLSEPFSSDAEATLGKLALELDDPKQAVLLLRRAIAAGAATFEDYYSLGLAFLRCGRRSLARRAFQNCGSPEFIRQRLNEVAGCATPR